MNPRPNACKSVEREFSAYPDATTGQCNSTSVLSPDLAIEQIVVSVVVPCYNEQPSIPNLAARMRDLLAQIPHRYALELVFVDDGSSDATCQMLHEVFGSWPDVQIVQHRGNRGLIAALLTGFQVAKGKWIACLDADCTYDPTVLVSLLAKMEDGFQVVSASPYHRHGKVENVAAWRIAISRVASGMYRWLFKSNLSCYTCCVRVYDANMVRNCKVDSTGFVGVTELLWRLDRKDARIAEVPAILHPRVTGVSKMRTVRTTCRHLRLLTVILMEKLFGISR